MTQAVRTEDETAEAVDENESVRFELPAQADIRSAAEVYALCRGALEADGDVVVGCQMVERVDAAMLQCLGALADGLRQGGRSLELVEASEPFTRAVSVLGLGPLLTGRA